jgi:hypothetical protein
MKKIVSLVVLAGLFGFSIGCDTGKASSTSKTTVEKSTTEKPAK